jgi:sugar lactone lactonase YvrE
MALAALVLGGGATLLFSGVANATFQPQKNLPFGGSPFTPEYITVDHSGNVYVSDATNGTTGRVLELPKSRTGFKSQKQLLFGGLSGGIAGVAVDGSQNVYVADSTNQNVKELPHSGGSQTTLPFGGSPFIPVGIAVDWKGNVYAADDGAGRVLELVKTNTGYQPQTQLPFSGLSTSLDGLAVDKFLNVYVVDNGNGNVQVLFHETGNQLTLPFGSISNPVGVAVDTHLSVYVTANNSGGNGSVIRIKRTAEEVYAAPEQLPIGGLASPPGGTAVDGNGSVYVADPGHNRAVWLKNS